MELKLKHILDCVCIKLVLTHLPTLIISERLVRLHRFIFIITQTKNKVTNQRIPSNKYIYF